MQGDRIRCPQGCNEGYVHSSGDGWDEWDECRCCNPKGENDTGLVSKRRLAAYRKAEAEEDARIDAVIRQWEKEQRQPCTKCGVPKIDHLSFEPCKTLADANREYAAASASLPSGHKDDGGENG